MAIGTPWVGTAVQGNVAGSNATTVTVDVSGAPPGEVVWIFGTVGDAQTSAFTAPSGWTILGQQSEGTSGGSSSRSVVMWKVKATTDTNVVIPSWPVTSKPQFVAMCWPGVDPSTPAEGLTWLAHTSGASYDTGTATPTAANRWGVGFFTSRGSTATVAWANATQTQRIGVINSSSIFVGLSVADTNGAVTQAAHSYTATGQTASHGLGAVLYLIPASPSTAPVVANVASANSNSAGYPVNVPTGTANGDLLIGVVASDFGTFAGNAFGTGWTALTTSQYDAGTNAFHIGLWGRVASSEPASYTVSHDSSDSVAAILRITGWDSASGLAGIVQVAPSTTGTGTTAPSAAPGGSDSLLITFHGAENSAGGARTWTPPTGMAELVDRQSTTWTTLEVNRLAGPSNPSGTKVATPSASVDTGAACTLIVNAPSSGFTGTAATTQADNASSASGVLGYTGTVASTQADQTSATSGTVANPVTGTAAVTQANNASSASGVLGYTGTISRTQAANTSAATGTLGYTGTVSNTQASNTSAASGVLGYSGTVSVAQANNTSTASGTVTQAGFSGTVSVTQQNNTSTAAGVLGYTGTAAANQASNTAAAAGVLGYQGTLARTQAGNTASASGLVGSGFIGSLSVTQASNTSTASGALGYAGTVSATQSNNTSTANGKLGYTGTVARSQAGNTAAVTGTVANPVSGTITVNQVANTASATGLTYIPIIGSLSETQANNTLAASGSNLGAVVIRPYEGTTSPANDGRTIRPFAGTTPRP